MFWTIAIAFAVIYGLNTILGLRQMKNFASEFRALRIRGRVAIGKRKGLLTAGAIVMFLLDEEGFIRDGRLVAVERMDDVRRSRKRVYVVTFACVSERDRFVATHSAAQNRGATSVEMVVAGGVDAFVKDIASFAVSDLAAREQTLEELFLHLYGAGEKEGLHE